MASGRNLTVYLTSDVSRFTKGLRKAETGMDRFKRVASGALLGVAAAAGAMAVKLGVDAVQAAIDEEKEVAQLAKTLENLGFADATDDVEAWVLATARATNASDSDLRPAMASLLTVTRDVTQAQTLLATALDLAAYANVPLEQAVKAVAKAADGQTTSLKRLIPGLESLNRKGATTEEVMAELARTVSGSAATAAGTLSGQLAQVSEDFDELKEAAGTGFLSAIGGANDGAGELSTTLQDLAPTAESVGAAIGGIAVSLGEVLKVIGPVVDGLNAINDATGGAVWQGTFQTVSEAAQLAVRVPAGLVTGNDAAVADAINDARPGTYVTNNSYDQYRPMRTAQRYRDASGTADARAAQRDARTRQRP